MNPALTPLSAREAMSPYLEDSAVIVLEGSDGAWTAKVGDGAEMVSVTGSTLEALVSEFKGVQEWWGPPSAPSGWPHDGTERDAEPVRAVAEG